MWNKIRARLGSDWRIILATLLAANLVFVLLLQMQRTAFYKQDVMMLNALQGASTAMTKREEERHKQLSLLSTNMFANFEQIQRGTDRIPVIVANQNASLEAMHGRLNNVMAHFNQVELSTDQIPTIASKQATALETVQKTLNDAIANLNQVQLGTNQIPAIASKNETSLQQIEKSLTDMAARLTRVEAQIATLPKPADGAATTRP